MEEKKHLLHVSQNFLTNVSLTLIDFAGGIIIARALGPEGKGLIFSIFFWPMLLSWIGGLGIGYANTYHIAKDPHKLPSILGNSLLLAFTLGFTLTLVFFPLAPFLFEDKSAIPFARLYFLFFPLFILADYIGWIFTGLKNYTFFNLSRASPRFLYLAGIIILLVTGHLNVPSVVIMRLIFSVITSLYFIFYLLKLSGFRIKVDFSLLKDSLKMSIKAHIGIVSNIGNKRADQAFLVAFYGSEAVGLYSVAVNISSSLWHLVNAVGFTIIPSVASLEKEEIKRKVKNFTVKLLILLFPLGVVLFFISPYLIRFLYGTSFLPCLPALKILIFASMVQGIGVIIQEALKGMKRPLLASAGGFIGTFTNLIFLALFLPRYGITGAALASLVSYTVFSLAELYFFRKSSL